jgi:uncharacterized membrane protein YfcA
MFGVGGGTVIVPALIFWMAFTPQQANAASLAAMMLPVGILGIYAYWKSGDLPITSIWIALFIAVGMVVGAYFGARIALVLPTQTLMRAFAVFLVFTAIRIWMKAG